MNSEEVAQYLKQHPEFFEEFADVVTRLWEAWEPDAVVLDRDTPMFADGSKVHPINHDGKYFKVRGPINAPRSPQGRVPICQAGGSPRGIEFVVTLPLTSEIPMP